MPQEMSSSWRYLNSARSHVSSLKGYLAGHESYSASRASRGAQDVDAPQSWRAWAGQKIRVRRKGLYGTGSVNTELVNVFPGWAVRRYPTNTTETGLSPDEPKPFQLEVFVSGYAISYRPPENASRSQRAFMRLARGYAYLPKLVEDAGDVLPHSSSFAQLTPSTEELLASVRLPPRPTEITDDFNMEALEQQLRRAKKVVGEDGFSANSSPSSSTDDLPAFGKSSQAVPPPYAPSPAGSMANDVIKRLHANLEKRLQPFWSSVLPNRTVRLHLFASPHQGQKETTTPRRPTAEEDEDELMFDSQNGPLVSQDVTTAADGSFQVKFSINWEELCHHPTALQIAFGEAITEHDLLVVAQLLPINILPGRSDFTRPPNPSSVPLTSLTRIPITHSPIRVISDVDDTIKLSGILLGARTVFHNVFVKDLTDNVIPGMGEWYASMWKNGVRFHYVSNGPFEYLPVLNEFFEISKLPPGSIKLRSYAGRSLFSGLLSAPAARKRAGVVDVLDSFQDSRFFLIGDSGEQDLELYADLARERPDRVLAVFVRDADASTDPLEDPTGWNAIAIGAAGTRNNDRPLVSRSETGQSTSSFSTDSFSRYNYSAVGSPLNPANADANQTPRLNAYTGKERQKASTTTYFSNNVLMNEPDAVEEVTTPTAASFARMDTPPSIGSRMSTQFTSQPPKPILPPSIHNSATLRSPAASARSQQTTSSTSSTDSSGKPLTESDKRRRDLQLRVYRARTQMPGHIPLRIFRDPEECVEAQQILARESSSGYS